MTGLVLTDFRCFARVALVLDARPVVLTGPNGAGKTNVLEALSLLTPGPGLRGARLAELRRRSARVAAAVETPRGAVDIGTGQADGESENRRVVRIDGRVVRGQAALAEAVGALWLTPSMDRMFNDGTSSRRRFFDRLVLGFDPGHATQLSAYERVLRERARLLRDGTGDAVWLEAIENTMAAHGVAVAAARRATLRRLGATLAAGVGPFPGAEAALEGTVDAEARFAEARAASRHHDAEAGGAAVGPHRTNLDVRHRGNGLPAAQCSTGEQKALLIAILLATARLQADERGQAPLLLLDEVAAHLDARHRAALFDALAAIDGQAWMTGTDDAVFAPLGSRAQRFAVQGGMITVGST